MTLVTEIPSCDGPKTVSPKRTETELKVRNVAVLIENMAYSLAGDVDPVIVAELLLISARLEKYSRLNS